MCEEIRHLLLLQPHRRFLFAPDGHRIIEDITGFVKRERSHQHQQVLKGKQTPRTRIVHGGIESGGQEIKQQPRQQLRYGAKANAVQISERDIEGGFNISLFLSQ